MLLVGDPVYVARFAVSMLVTPGLFYLDCLSCWGGEYNDFHPRPLPTVVRHRALWQRCSVWTLKACHAQDHAARCIILHFPKIYLPIVRTKCVIIKNRACFSLVRYVQELVPLL